MIELREILDSSENGVHADDSWNVRCLKNKILRFDPLFSQVTVCIRPCEITNSSIDVLFAWCSRIFTNRRYAVLEVLNSSPSSTDLLVNRMSELLAPCADSFQKVYHATRLDDDNLLCSGLICNYDVLVVDINIYQDSIIAAIGVLQSIVSLNSHLKLRICIVCGDKLSADKISALCMRIASSFDPEVIEAVFVPWIACWRPDTLIGDKTIASWATNIRNIIVNSNMNKYPCRIGYASRYTYCLAEHWNHHLVDQSGNIYGCYYHLNKSEPIANVCDSNHDKSYLDIKANACKRLLTKDLHDSVHCRQCDLLPYCNGGCRLGEIGQDGVSRCFTCYEKE